MKNVNNEIRLLNSKVNEIKKELDEIKKSRIILVTEDLIIKEWDNEYDERWNNC